MTDYICAICGKHYNSIEDRNICESECIKKEKKSLKAKEQDALCIQIEKLMNDIDAYVQKHGATSFMFGNNKLTFFLDKSISIFPPHAYSFLL